jgi:hypothetical protein
MPHTLINGAIVKSVEEWACMVNIEKDSFRDEYVYGHCT